MTDDSVKLIRDRLRSVVIVRAEDGVGSGFYASHTGIIVTNRHVVGPYTKLAIQRYDRSKAEVRVVRVARRYDLALLLDEEADPPPPLSIGDASAMEAGESVFAIGHPVGLEWTVTRGIVSANNRLYQDAYHLQTDAVIHPGSSGGPLLSARGDVVGVSTFGLNADGLNFALAARYVRELLGELIVKPAPSTHACPACGAKNSAARRRCRKCGASFEERAPAPAVAAPAFLAELQPAPAELSVGEGGACAFTWHGSAVHVAPRDGGGLAITLGAAAGEAHGGLSTGATIEADAGLVDARRFATILTALIEARQRIVTAW